MLPIFAAMAYGTRYIALSVPARLNIFDEGLLLSSGTFVRHGLVPTVDFYLPYGPATAYVFAAIGAISDNIAVYRLVGVLVGVAMTALAVRLVWVRAGALAAVATGAVILALPPQSLPHSLSFTLLLLCALMLLRADHVPAQQTLFVTAAVLAPVGWLRYEFALVPMVWFAVACVRYGRRALAPSLVNLGAIALPYMAMLLLGGNSNLLETVRYALLHYPRFRALPFPWDAPLVTGRGLLGGAAFPTVAMAQSMAYHTAAVVATAGVWNQWRRTRGKTIGTATDAHLLLLIATIVLLLSNRVRPDFPHALYVITPMVVLFQLQSAGRLRLRLNGILLLLVIPMLLPLAPSLSDAALRTVELLGASRHHQIALLADQPGMAEVAERLADAPALFVANTRNDLTFVNAAAMYWASGAQPASWLTIFDPGFADQREVHEAVIAELCASRPTVVLWEAPIGGELSGVGPFSSTLDRFLASAGSAEQFGEFTILQLDQASCPAR